MDGRPDAAELIEAVAAFLDGLTEQAVPTPYEARVAANVLRIVERELRAGAGIDADAATRLALLPGAPADSAELAASIRAGELSWDDPALRTHLIADVRARLAVDNPTYAAVRAAAARWD